EVVAHWLDVHQGAAVVEVELTVVVVDHRVAEVHELGRGAYVDLHALEARLDAVAFESEQALHALGVERAGRHPLVDGDVAHHVDTVADDGRHARPVDQLPGEQVLAGQGRQLLVVEVGDRAVFHSAPNVRGIRPPGRGAGRPAVARWSPPTCRRSAPGR